MAALAGLGGGEGVDHGFSPDAAIDDGERVRGSGWEVTALWTRGHFGNHMTFLWNGAAFTGDLVMGWASSLISPPDGDLTDFMFSCERLRECALRRLYLGHGAPMEAPAQRIWRHRPSGSAGSSPTGEAAKRRSSTASPKVRQMPTGSRGASMPAPPALMSAATRNVLAHLVDLHQRAVVGTSGAPAANRFCLRSER